MIIYLDISAALKLVITEAETTELSQRMTARSSAGDSVVAGMLLLTELHCAANRRADFDPTGVNVLLRSIELVAMEQHDFIVAAAMPGRLRSANALHLAVALRLQCDVVVTYDQEMAAAATTAGLMVAAPA